MHLKLRLSALFFFFMGENSFFMVICSEFVFLSYSSKKKSKFSKISLNLLLLTPCNKWAIVGVLLIKSRVKVELFVVYCNFSVITFPITMQRMVFVVFCISIIVGQLVMASYISDTGTTICS